MHIDSKLPDVGTTIFSVVNQLANKHGAVNLGQGAPDFETPAPLREAVARAMEAGENQYAPGNGMPVLCEAIAEKTTRLYRQPIDAATQVTITSGASEAIFIAVAAVVRAGDEVIVFDPAYDCYEPAVTLQGGVTVHIPLLTSDFSIDWERLRDAINSRTRMIIINSPHNPTGALLSKSDLDTLATLIRDRDIVVLSDEVYQHIVYADEGHQSVSSHEELAMRSFVVNSFGKTWHCTGWKVGYCTAPAHLMKEFRKVHQYITFCTSKPFQIGLAEVLTHHADHYLGLSAFYRKKRDMLRTLLKPSRFRLLDAAGGYFQLVDYRAIRYEDDIEFSQWLAKEGGVAAIPVSPFYKEKPDLHLVRLCFAKRDETLQAAAERLCRL